MSKLKFRLWLKSEKKMLFQEFWDRNWYTSEGITETGCNTYCYKHDVIYDKNALMQWSGFKDCNGKNIYEGDIIVTNFDLIFFDFKNEVIFDEGCFKVKRDGEIDNILSNVNLENCKVAGNIYENPELLEKN